MAFIGVVGARDALCGVFLVPGKSLMSPFVGRSSALKDPTPSLLERRPRVCVSTIRRERSTARGLGFRMVCNSSSKNRILNPGIPWEDALDSFVVDVLGADATALNVPLLAPFTIATTKLEKVRNVAIRVVLSDGSVGWGEAPTLPPVTAEDQSVALAKADQACVFLKAQSGRSLRDILQQLSRILPGHDFASMCG